MQNKNYFKRDSKGHITAEKFRECLKDIRLFKHLDSEARENTPARFLSALIEMCEGLYTDPPLMTTFRMATNPFVESKCMSQKVEKLGIDFTSVCPHHLMPYFGTVDVTYIPKEKYVGISKIDRMVRWCAKRPITQEELGEMIINRLLRGLECEYIRVVINAKHTCNCCRGVATNATTSTVHELDLRGQLNEN